MECIDYYTEVKNRMAVWGQVAVRVSAAGPQDHRDGQVLQVTAPPSIMSENRTAYHQPRKKSKFKIKSMVYTECVSFLHHHKVKKSLSQTIVSLGLSVHIHIFF